MKLFKNIILEKFDYMVNEWVSELIAFTFEKDCETTKILAGKSEENARLLLKEELDKLEEFNFEQYEKDGYIIFHISTLDANTHICLYFK